jgi:hypothetical protein
MHRINVEETNVTQSDGSKPHTPVRHYTSWTYNRICLWKEAQWSPNCFQASVDRTVVRHMASMVGEEILTFVDDILVAIESYARRTEVLQAYTCVVSDGWTLARQKTNLFSRSLYSSRLSFYIKGWGVAIR